jgi:aspartate kinase
VEEIQIWTDVDGLMSADPRHVPAARTLSRISFTEAAELALYGARVLHPDSIEAAVREQIPVRVLNSMRPAGAGTLVVPDGEPGDTPVAVVSRDRVTLVRLAGRQSPVDAFDSARVLRLFAEAGVVPELVVACGTTLTVALSDERSLEILGSLRETLEIEAHEDRGLVCVVGLGLARNRALRERVLVGLGRAGPDVIAMGASQVSIAAVIRRSELAEGVRSLHDQFFEGEVD